MLVIPPPSPRPEAVPEPTTWDDVAALFADADADYERLNSPYGRHVIRDWRASLDAHIAIDNLPWHKRLWAKLSHSSSETDHRAMVTVLTVPIIWCLVLMALPSPNGAFLFAGCVGILSFSVILALYLRHVLHCFSRKRAYLIQMLEEKEQYAKPDGDTVVRNYLIKRLAPTSLAVRTTDVRDAMATLMTSCQKAILTGGSEAASEQLLAAAMSWAKNTAEQLELIAAVIGWIRMGADDILDGLNEDTAESLTGRLERLLPKINTVLPRILLAKTALQAGSTRDILDSPSWKELGSI